MKMLMKPEASYTFRLQSEDLSARMSYVEKLKASVSCTFMLQSESLSSRMVKAAASYIFMSYSAVGAFLLEIMKTPASYIFMFQSEGLSSRMGCVDRLKASASCLFLEPAVFLFYISYGIFFVTSQQLYIEKACKV